MPPFSPAKPKSLACAEKALSWRPVALVRSQLDAQPREEQHAASAEGAMRLTSLVMCARHRRERTVRDPCPGWQSHCARLRCHGRARRGQEGRPKKKKVVKPSGPPAKELFGAVKTSSFDGRTIHRFLCEGMSRWRCRAADQRASVAGHAPLPQPELGAPGPHRTVEKLAVDARKHDGWPGLLVGDISQPRGGPMLTRHASHQVGLDADIWLTPMPDRRLSEKEREDMSATSMLAADQVSVDPKIWTDAHVRLLKRAASYSGVERIFVHPAIKKALCEATATDADRSWLHKIRAYWGHDYHFHVRISCPAGSTSCEAQPPLPNDDGCGKDLANWLALVKPKPKPETPPEAAPKPTAPKPGLTLDQLPAECRSVLASGSATPVIGSNAVQSNAAAKKATTTK